MAEDAIKLIEIQMVVGDDTITAAYVDPEKIAGMLMEERSLGGFLREMLLVEHEQEEKPLPLADPPRTITQRELDLLNGFEALVEKSAMTPLEVRALVCGIVAGFAAKTDISLEDLYDDIDAAYAYKLAHEGRPS